MTRSSTRRRKGSSYVETNDPCVGGEARSMLERSRRWNWRAAVLFAIVLAVTPASSSGATDKVTGSFVQRVNAICAANVNKYPPVGPFPYSNFNPQHPLASQLRVIGAYFAQNQRGIQPFESALTSLGQPSRGRAAWHHVKSLALAILENEKAQKNAALAGNVHRFVATVNEGERLLNRLNAAATQAGFPVTGACSKIL